MEEIDRLINGENLDPFLVQHFMLA